MLLLVIFVRGGQVNGRDVFNQISSSQAQLVDGSSTANNWMTGVSSDYRTYNPTTSRFAAVAPTRSSVFDPQKSFSNLMANGRYSSGAHYFANSSQYTGPTANRISYLAPSTSRPKVYFWEQEHRYFDPTKATFANQSTNGLSFYRISDGNRVVLDQFTNNNPLWLYYNHINLDNNLMTVSSAAAISKIETSTIYQDNTANPTTPLLFQTHGGMPENGQTVWHTDYARDSFWLANDRDTYIIYRPNFGSITSIPVNIELEGEWRSNTTGERSGS